MKDQDGQVGEGVEGGSNERDILLEGAILGLGRNLVPGNLS